MKNNSKFNKGFVVPAIIAIIAILIAGGAYVTVKKNNAQNTQSTEVAGNTNATIKGDEGSDYQPATEAGITWKIYNNAEFGYKFSYPSNWKISGLSHTLNIRTQENSQVGLQIQSEKIKNGVTLKAFVPTINELTGTQNVTENVTINGHQSIHTKETGDGVYYLVNGTTGYRIIIFSDHSINHPTSLADIQLINKVLNSFEFTSSVVEQNPTVQTPIIASITQSAVVGGLVEVKGKGFSGFEGDKNLWIENADGNKAVIYGASGSSDTLIKFTLASKYCTTDTSNSGAPCPSYLTVVPGIYTVYAAPWGKMSNKVTFTVLPSPVIAPSIQIISPNNGESFKIGQKMTVTWKTSGTILPAYRLVITLDGGQMAEVNPLDGAVTFDVGKYAVRGDVLIDISPSSNHILAASLYDGERCKQNCYELGPYLINKLAGDVADQQITLTN